MTSRSLLSLSSDLRSGLFFASAASRAAWATVSRMSFVARVTASEIEVNFLVVVPNISGSGAAMAGSPGITAGSAGLG